MRIEYSLTALLTQDLGDGFAFHVSRDARVRYELNEDMFALRGTLLIADFAQAQTIAHRINQKRDVAHYPHLAVKAGDLYAAGLIHEILHLALQLYKETIKATVIHDAEQHVSTSVGHAPLHETQRAFTEYFPPKDVYAKRITPEAYLNSSTGQRPNREVITEEMLLLYLSNNNPALERFIELFDDSELEKHTAYLSTIESLKGYLSDQPGFKGSGLSLYDFLRAPVLASPTSLEGQLEFMRATWGGVLGDKFTALLTRVLTTLDVLKEERKPGGFGGGPGPSQVLDVASLKGEMFRSQRTREEYERFSVDTQWMPRVVLIAKTIYVWLDQLSRAYQKDIHRLDQIPDAELDELERRGFTSLWLIGLWERSEASKRIKHLRGNPDAVASAYALYDYQIAADLGGDAAYENLRDRAAQRGIRLASDMVPNHVGIDGRWVIEHPDWFISLDHSPYPGYSFNGPNLSSDSRVGIYLEDHYYDSTDAAVVFKRVDHHTGDTRYVYHGNDGTTMPWNDTAQIDYLNPEAREAVIQTILHVARKFPVIRFDAAMTLAKQHVQRLWYPEPGSGGAIPSRAQYGSMSAQELDKAMPKEFWREVVDRVAQEVPDTLLLAEAFWMMEGYFVRTLGMHRVYNSAFMNMLKKEDNAEYRQSIKNVLSFDPEILKRFVNFMNNPDEETAVAQFGKDDKYFGVCILMSTMPGLPMFGHGQIEGFTEKYGMEYRRAKWQETPDQWLIDRHYREVFPLLHRREQFAEVDNFLLYDLYNADGSVNENVFAYSNNINGNASLVLYNNKFADARGWIKTSLPYTEKHGDDRREGVQKNLHEGLGLHANDKQYTIYQDHIQQLEFLVPSASLKHEGMFVELGAFKYRVLLDFREVTDTTGEYQQLCEQLAGRGVASVEDALADLRLRSLHDVFAALLTETPVTAQTYSTFVQTAFAFGLELEGVPVDTKTSLEESETQGTPTNAQTQQPASTTDAMTSDATKPSNPDSSSVTDVPVVSAFAEKASSTINTMLDKLTELPAYDASTEALLTNPDFINTLKALVLLTPIEQAAPDTYETHVSTWRIPSALRTVLTDEHAQVLGNVFTVLTHYERDLQAFITVLMDDDTSNNNAAHAYFKTLTADTTVRRLLGVNTHQGVTWYSQEAFALLAQSLSAHSMLISLSTQQPAQPDTPQDVVTRVMTVLSKLEAASGYKLAGLSGEEAVSVDASDTAATSSDADEEATTV